jgi:hypothetical protein
MHQPDQLRTLIACIDDLTRTVEALRAQGEVHRADQDLLLYHARLFYEALLHLPVGKAEMPVNAASQAIAQEIKVAEAPITLVDDLEKVIEAAVEEALATGDTIEIDIEQSAGPELEAAPTSEEALALAATSVEAEATPSSQAKIDTVEEAAVAVPAPEVADTDRGDLAAVPHQSLAFSLTGIIERSGDSQLVMAHLKLKPIDDLKSGIGLNEKFLFIRELFNNDHLAYAEAIEKLNAASNLGEAEKILGEQLLTHHGWDLETEAAMSFLHLVFRRFGSNQ